MDELVHTHTLLPYTIVTHFINLVTESCSASKKDLECNIAALMLVNILPTIHRTACLCEFL